MNLMRTLGLGRKGFTGQAYYKADLREDLLKFLKQQNMTLTDFEKLKLGDTNKYNNLATEFLNKVSFGEPLPKNFGSSGEFTLALSEYKKALKDPKEFVELSYKASQVALPIPKANSYDDTNHELNKAKNRFNQELDQVSVDWDRF